MKRNFLTPFTFVAVGLLLGALVEIWEFRADTRLAASKVLRQTAADLGQKIDAISVRLDLERSDLESWARFFAELPPISGIDRALRGNGLDRSENTSLALWKQRLGGIFVAAMRADKKLLQVRLIASEDGRELVRVEREAQSGAVRVVDEAKLSYKGHRHYVQGALAAKPGQVYVSPIDLNREQGRVDPALQPTIRGSLAVRSAQGDVFGAVVVNHDAQNLLTELQAIAIDSGQLYVTDQRGQFLVHPSAGVAFAHESDPGKPGLVWNQQFAPESKPEGLLGAALPDGLEAMRGPNGPVIFASLNNASVFGDASDEQRLQVRIGMAPQVLSERIAHERSDIFYPQLVAFGTAFLCGALVLLAVSRRSALQSARNQERFQTIFTDAPGAQLILDMSRQRVTDCNQAALALFGMSRDELVSSRVPQLFADSESGGLPSRLSAVSTLESALSGVGVEFSAWLARARGARFLAEVRGRRIEIEDEPALLIHLTDVTEADRLQVMLRAARDRLQWLADRVPVMIAQFDLERRYRFANASYAQWYGRDADQLVGLHVREVIGEEGYSESSGHIAETLSGAPLVEYERTVRKATGDRTLLIRNVPDLDEQGELSGYIVALTDVTTLRLAEQQLLESREVIQAQANRLRVLNVQLTERAELADQASRAKSEFLSTMSHELRTPLNAVIGYATLLKASVVDAQPRESIDRILAASEHLLAMISDVLDFDRIEGGYLELVAEDFSLLDLLAQVQAIVELQAEEKGLVLRVDVASGDLWLLGDKGRLRQCLLNYLSNALKFTDSGSITVTVETVSADEREIMLRFAVSDTGIGIATQEQLNLFTPFRQLDMSSTRKFGGTGLGLAITHQLASAMGGETGLISQPGSGSTFWFTAKLARGDQNKAGDAEQTQGEVFSSLRTMVSGKRALLAEDDPISRALLGQILESLGCIVTEAENGEQVLHYAAGGPFEFVLMDVQMPGMTGLEVTVQLRKMPAWQEVPIIATTADARPEAQEACLAAGMNGYLTKPINQGHLFAILLRCLGGSESNSNSGILPDLQSDLVQVTPWSGLRAKQHGGGYPGLSLDEGARRWGGQEAFLRMLELFVEQHTDTVDRIRNATPTVARKLAHRLKGSAQTIPLNRVASLAIALEKSLESDAPDDKALNALQEAHQQALASIAQLARDQNDRKAEQSS